MIHEQIISVLKNEIVQQNNPKHKLPEDLQHQKYLEMIKIDNISLLFVRNLMNNNNLTNTNMGFLDHCYIICTISNRKCYSFFITCNQINYLKISIRLLFLLKNNKKNYIKNLNIFEIKITSAFCIGETLQQITTLQDEHKSRKSILISQDNAYSNVFPSMIRATSF